jgi:hypothetical protein
MPRGSAIRFDKSIPVIFPAALTRMEHVKRMLGSMVKMTLPSIRSDLSKMITVAREDWSKDETNPERIVQCLLFPLDLSCSDNAGCDLNPTLDDPATSLARFVDHNVNGFSYPNTKRIFMIVLSKLASETYPWHPPLNYSSFEWDYVGLVCQMMIRNILSSLSLDEVRSLLIDTARAMHRFKLDTSSKEANVELNRKYLQLIGEGSKGQAHKFLSIGMTQDDCFEIGRIVATVMIVIFALVQS